MLAKINMAVRHWFSWVFLLSVFFIIEIHQVLCYGDQSNDFLKHLNDGNFEHLTQASTGATTGDWLVLFYSDSKTCHDCEKAKVIFKGIAEQWHSRKNIALIDSEKNPELTERFKLESYPDILLFRLGYKYQYSGDLHYTDIESFLDGGFQSFKKEKVIPPSSGWDLAMESLMRTIKGCFTPSCCWTKSVLAIGGIAVLMICFKMFKSKPIETKRD